MNNSRKPGETQEEYNKKFFKNVNKQAKQTILKSFAVPFNEYIFNNINNDRFACFYQDLASGEHIRCYPCVILGALLLCQMYQMTEQDLIDTLRSGDLRFRYALGLPAEGDVPLSRSTLYRFVRKDQEFAIEHGYSLIHQEMTELSEGMGRCLNCNFNVIRMDSMMVSANVKQRSREQLLFSALSRLVHVMEKSKVELPEELERYTSSGYYNSVFYHNKSLSKEEKRSQILADVQLALKLCPDRCFDTAQGWAFMAIFTQQTLREPDGTLRMREKKDGLSKDLIQSPDDLDARYRRKYTGEVGYVLQGSSVTPGGLNGGTNILVQWDYQPNTVSDSELGTASLEQLRSADPEGPAKLCVTDGGYTGKSFEKTAEDKNFIHIPTGLPGLATDTYYAGFNLNEEKTSVLSCPGGSQPIDCKLSGSRFLCHFGLEKCQDCPYKEQCKKKELKRKPVATVYVSPSQISRAQALEKRKSALFKKSSDFRSGVECAMGHLRNVVKLDRMPNVHGKIPRSQTADLKVGASNILKLVSAYFDPNQSIGPPEKMRIKSCAK